MTDHLNRLIITGNGFDLAHGLKTSYNEFILWYLKKAFGTAEATSNYEDGLITLAYDNSNPPGRLDVSGLIDHYYRNQGFSDLIANKPHFARPNDRPPFRVQLKSAFLEKLLTKCTDSNWIDIENLFYEELKDILEQPSPKAKEASLKELNIVMGSLISFLEKYLSEQPGPGANKEYTSLLTSKITQDDVVEYRLKEETRPDSTMILNFNYTSTIRSYLDTIIPSEKAGDFQVNYIHGQLNNLQNPIIFGFGDELDEYYRKIETEKIKGFFEYIKSFWYFKTSNYHDLVRFTDAAKFQVFIWGHSCGLSDRTMLNMIFEHRNCVSIKLFYHENAAGHNNFRAMTQEISRHFRDKGIMRKKIVPFDRSLPMPQAAH